MKIVKLKTKKIREFLLRLPRMVAKNQFLISLILIFLALILSSFIFYKYGILAERKEIEVLEKPLHFNEKTLQEILKVWAEREKRFNEAGLKEYPDPFKID